MANELTIKDLKENSDAPACKFVVSTDLIKVSLQQYFYV